LLQNPDHISDASTVNNNASATLAFIVPTCKENTTEFFIPSQFTGELLSTTACKIQPENMCCSYAPKILQKTLAGDSTTPVAAEMQTNNDETKSQRRDRKVAVAPTNAVLPTLPPSGYGCKWCDARFERCTQLGQHVAHKHPGKSKHY
jgi:hypothetical protein